VDKIENRLTSYLKGEPVRQNLFRLRFILVLLIPALIGAADYFPLTTGSRWHYRFVQPNAPATYHAYRIVSDTVIGQRHYFVR
jgi:hypothetical protein